MHVCTMCTRVRRCIRNAAYKICWHRSSGKCTYDGVSLYEIVFNNVLPMHAIFILFPTRDRAFVSGRFNLRIHCVAVWRYDFSCREQVTPSIKYARISEDNISDKQLRCLSDISFPIAFTEYIERYRGAGRTSKIILPRFRVG